MSSSALLIQTGDKLIPPFKPKFKDVFFPEIISKQNNNKMVKSHNKSREELKKMKVAELRALVRKHNLHNQIKGYTTMKKTELVEALMVHKKGSGGSSMDIPPPARKRRGRPKKAKAPEAIVEAPKKRGRPKKKPEPIPTFPEERPKRKQHKPKRLIEN